MMKTAKANEPFLQQSN